jgi:hypothetical protein
MQTVFFIGFFEMRQKNNANDYDDFSANKTFFLPTKS